MTLVSFSTTFSDVVAVTTLTLLVVMVTGDDIDQYELYYPTLFQRDHRQFLQHVSADHRHQYLCECTFVVRQQQPNHNTSRLQARVDSISAKAEQWLTALNDTELKVLQLDQQHIDELSRLSVYDTRPSMTSSSSSSSSASVSPLLTQQQLFFVILPCAVILLFISFAVCLIVTSIIRRNGKRCRRGRRGFLDNGIGPSLSNCQYGGHQQQVPGGVQLCTLNTRQHQQQQQLYDTLALGVLKLVPQSTDELEMDVGPSCSDRQKLTENDAITDGRQQQQQPYAGNQWSHDMSAANTLPIRKQVSVKCYMDTSTIHTVLIPKPPSPSFN